MSDFYRYFKENMDALGLPAPESLFSSATVALGNASAILSQVDKFGTRVTIREIVGAGTRLEGLAAIAGCSAAFYVGAVVGSVAVATGRTMASGTSLADVIFLARKYRLDRAWLASTLRRRPGIYQQAAPARRNCRHLGHV